MTLSVEDQLVVYILSQKEDHARPPIREEYIQYLAYAYTNEEDEIFTDFTNSESVGPTSDSVRETLTSLVNRDIIFRKETRTFGGEKRVQFRLSSLGREKAEMIDFESAVVQAKSSLPLSNLLKDISQSNHLV